MKTLFAKSFGLLLMLALPCYGIGLESVFKYVVGDSNRDTADAAAAPIVLPKSRGGKERQVVNSTRHSADNYFGGRFSVGSPLKYPFLCYMLLTKPAEYHILRHNIEAFDHRCEWAITANTANGLDIDVEDLKEYAVSHNSEIVMADITRVSGYLVKTSLWKDVVLKMYDRYSHVWFIDADIQFLGQTGIEAILTDWLCGSVGGHPPLVSQPTIRANGELQDYAQVNYYSSYSESPLSVIGTSVVENQVVLADINFLRWLFIEIVAPYFEKIPEFNVTAWGLSRTWCGAARTYIALNNEYHLQFNRTLTLPRACGIMAHPVYHVSTHGIKKTSQFIAAGNSMAKRIHQLFPLWNDRYKKLTGYPSTLLRLINTIQGRARIDKMAGGMTDYGVVMSNEKATHCRDREVAYGAYDGLGAYIWV